MKNTIKVYYADFWPEWKDEDFITPILKNHFNVIIDSVNPDVVFHSIFGNTQEQYKCKKILYLGENIRYNYGRNIRANINKACSDTDHIIGFDPHTDKNYRLPLWQAYILKNPAYLDNLLNKVHHESFDRFASFVVTNPSNFVRNSIYQQLSAFKPVSSYGKYMPNDFSLQRLSGGRHWRQSKEEFFNKTSHKFAITYENTSYPYYCTEKLMDGFLAGSIPIYWGDPKVTEDWNNEAFINANKLGSGVTELIKKLDSNPDMFNEIYSQPVFTNSQQAKLVDNLGEFEKWLIKNIN